MTRSGRRTVAVVYDDGLLLGSLAHLVRHSPDGFEWGYGGSGPADLARSIVGDLLETEAPIAADYQRVKSALIATLPEKGGEIFADQVLEVLFGRLEEFAAAADRLSDEIPDRLR